MKGRRVLILFFCCTIFQLVWCMRERRSNQEENCHRLSVEYANCTEKISWNITELFSSTNCTERVNSSLCVERKLCLNGGCRSVVWGSVIESHSCRDDEGWKKLVLLKILCTSKDVNNHTCAKALSEAYFKVANKEIQQNPGVSSMQSCLDPLLSAYNCSGNETEFLPPSWIKFGMKAQEKCSIQQMSLLQTTSAVPTTSPKSTLRKTSTTKKTKPLLSTTQSKKTTTVAPTTGLGTKMPQTKAPAKKKDSKITSKLKASLVIASIIFVVLAFVIGRFIYHRIQRKKRAKYEDYGYSQLKVILDDNLYEDDEDDDDQLLSAT